MKTYAIIENNKVINTIIYEDDVIVTEYPECPSNAGIGFSYINGNFIDDRPVIAAAPIVQLSKDELIEQIKILSEQVQALA
jgi:hypothetical protein